MRFHDVRHKLSHEYACVWCERCKRWVEQRHTKKCRGKKKSGKEYACPICRHLLVQRSMPRHMLLCHKIAGWRWADHPELKNEVTISNLITFLSINIKPIDCYNFQIGIITVHFLNVGRVLTPLHTNIWSKDSCSYLNRRLLWLLQYWEVCKYLYTQKFDQ